MRWQMASDQCPVQVKLSLKRKYYLGFKFLRKSEPRTSSIGQRAVFTFPLRVTPCPA